MRIKTKTRDKNTQDEDSVQEYWRRRLETRILKMNTRDKNTQDEDSRQEYSGWRLETKILKMKTQDKNTQDEDSRQQYSRRIFGTKNTRTAPTDLPEDAIGQAILDTKILETKKAHTALTKLLQGVTGLPEEVTRLIYAKIWFLNST